MNPVVKNRVTELLSPVFQTLPPEAAKRITEIEADAAVQDRITYLAGRANEGELTDDERAEYESIIDAGDIVATLKAIARRSLQTSTAAE